ncbi:nucleotidyltransferase domain-containing protein [Ideonella azotifigens]|uniref:Polymerase nucleotidyl transferase domain-containing protein n=1 Tax=Ideonella azotifigens TaxID=513160 RepID=A0ABN1JQM8_9BURK|nr:nucleotidyltransferase domain-containing protein [Ideonella azotifigens]MCD2340193.1 nucleotidyltransferase domain-containing protein [Ideonella azotifigens]
MGIPRFIQERRGEVAALCERHRARKLELFGSATRADFQPERSDLDFLVEWPDDFPPGGYAASFFGLKQDLEILFARPVDLLTNGSIANPYLRQQVDSERLPLYGE